MNIQSNNDYIKRIILLFLGVFLFGQTEREPFSDEKSDKIYYIQSTSEDIHIDGYLNDPAWSKILPITDFVQEEPENMAEPSQNTEVFLTYNN